MSKSIADNDQFVYLLLAAKEDENMRARLLEVLRKDDINRIAEIESWAQASESKNAPQAFVQALRYLKNTEVAFKAIEVLSTTE
jgi:hypothetical protein